MKTTGITGLFFLMIVLFMGCNTTAQKGKRDKQNDTICAPKNQQAYSFSDPKDAVAKGCDEVRQHMGIIDPKTGQQENIEMLIWCCPQ